jgi:hypothetical protein
MGKLLTFRSKNQLRWCPVHYSCRSGCTHRVEEAQRRSKAEPHFLMLSAYAIDRFVLPSGRLRWADWIEWIPEIGRHAEFRQTDLEYSLSDNSSCFRLQLWSIDLDRSLDIHGRRTREKRFVRLTCPNCDAGEGWGPRPIFINSVTFQAMCHECGYDPDQMRKRVVDLKDPKLWRHFFSNEERKRFTGWKD